MAIVSQPSAGECSPPTQTRAGARPRKIWIDLDNTPHVPFFAPIIEELQKRGYEVVVTARDCFQVCSLADLFHLKYKNIGRHYGKHKLLKGLGLAVRGVQLLPTALREKPDLSLSHGSRSQVIASKVLGIPSVVIFDYEYAKILPLMQPTWLIAPEVIPDSAIAANPDRVFRYPGIKEDVYVPRFEPDPAIREELGLDESSVVVTARPPANEAHYYNPESDRLFQAAIDLLVQTPDTRIVMLPRNARQETFVRQMWPQHFANGKIIIPRCAVDGLNLIWHSDLVISGGGTMNREAAALRVPVYSVFRGTIGAVDRYLADSGRLVLLESVEDVRTKLRVIRRSRPTSSAFGGSDALSVIVNQIIELAEVECRTA
jgi:hypothetical protein